MHLCEREGELRRDGPLKWAFQASQEIQATGSLRIDQEVTIEPFVMITNCQVVEKNVDFS
jgi:hypothetical protein